MPVERLASQEFTLRDLDSGDELSEAAIIGRLLLPFVFVMIWMQAMLAELARPGHRMTLNLIAGRGSDYAAEMRFLCWKIRRGGRTEPSLAEMARSVGMSRAHFCRCYVKANGTTPHRDLVEARIRRAKEMLRNSRWTVKEIAARLGYCGTHFFCRQFKDHVGLTPGEFREKG